MRHRASFVLSILLGATIGSTAVGQSGAERRDRRPIVQVTGIGEGEPVVLRWRPSPGQTSTVQISTRTVSSGLERPDLEDLDTEIVLTGFDRPPIQKLWTIEGRVDRKPGDSDATDRVRWRILDAVARLVGIKETRSAAGNAPSPAEPTPPPKDAEKPIPDRNDQLGNKVPPPTASDPNALARAIKLEGVINASLVGTKGAAITQTFGGTGIAPGATTIRLENTSRRAQFEGEVLRHALEMVELQLPTEPIGVGGTWTSRWSKIQNDIEVEVVVEAKLLSVDDGEPMGGRIARTAVVQIEYQRRAVDPQADARLRSISEADGRGRIRLDLEAPLRLDARLVETPPGAARPGFQRLVTRIRANTIK